MSQQQLAGQVAWVSGGTSGIGAAICELFAREGARLVITGHDAAAGVAMVERVRALGSVAVYCPGCLSQESTIVESIALAERTFGRLDILISNAGMVLAKWLHESTVEDWDQLMNVNVRATFLAFKHAFPLLRRNERSYVVINGSISSFVGQALTPIYSTSKGALLLLGKSIALDYAQWNIRCNVVCPGITDTPMLREHLESTGNAEAALAERSRRVPLGAANRAEDVAKSFLYLSCEDSAGITGTSLVVDGGYLAAAEWDCQQQAVRAEAVRPN